MPHSPGLFTIEGLDATYEGYSDGSHWNGWACPVFTRAVAVQIAEDFKTQGERYGLKGTFEAWYDAERDAFLFRDPSDDPLEFGSGQIEVEGQPVNVYWIGTQYWTWEAVQDSP